MVTYEGIRLKIRKGYIKLTDKSRCKKILDNNFTITSN